LQPRRVHYSLVSYQCTVDESSSARILFAYMIPVPLTYCTTCLEIGPELPVLETRHDIYRTLCYSITSTDHGGVGRWRKGDELATTLYPIRSRAVISRHIRHVPKVPSISADVYDFRESTVNQFQGKVASSFKTC
jgi:hypothetical protein